MEEIKSFTGYDGVRGFSPNHGWSGLLK